MSDRTRSKIDQLEFSFECVMTMLTEFSNALEKPPFQMRSGITSYISQYEVCLGCGATAVLARAKKLEAMVAVIFISRKASAGSLQLCRRCC